MEIAAARAVQLVAGTESTYEVAGDFAIVDPVADGACGASLVCVDFPAATDFADNALAGVVAGVGLCSGFGALLSNQQPGWLFFDNQAAPTAVQFEALPHSCADSSLSDAACAALSANTPLGIGSWMKVSYSSSVLAAMTSVAMGGVTHRTRLPAAGDDLALQGCRNVAPAAQCELFAARRGGARRFCAPTARFRHGCARRRSGYCRKRGGAPPRRRPAYVSAFGFPGLGERRPRGRPEPSNRGEGDERDHHGHRGVQGLLRRGRVHLRRLELVRGEVRGAASSGVLVRPELSDERRRGGCCADAGLCCDPGTPIDGATQPSGGCLLPPAVALTTEVTHWAERDDGVVTSLASPGSVVYVKVSANKPVDVAARRVGRAVGEPEQHRGRVRRRRDRARADEPRGGASGVRGGRHDGVHRGADQRREGAGRLAAGDDSLDAGRAPKAIPGNSGHAHEHDTRRRPGAGAAAGRRVAVRHRAGGEDVRAVLHPGRARRHARGRRPGVAERARHRSNHGGENFRRGRRGRGGRRERGADHHHRERGGGRHQIRRRDVPADV